MCFGCIASCPAEALGSAPPAAISAARRWAMAHGNLSSATPIPTRNHFSPIPTRRPDLACSVSSSRSRKSRPVQIRAQSRWRPGPIVSSEVNGRDGGRVDALSGFSSLGFDHFDIFSHVAGKDLASGGSGVDTFPSGDGRGGGGKGSCGGGSGGGGRDGDDGHSGGKDGANKPLWMLLSPADLMRKLLKTLRALPEIGKDGEVMLSVICCNNAKDPSEIPSSSECSSSSVSMDTSRASSFDRASSKSDISSLGPEGTHSCGNSNEAMKSIKIETARTEEPSTRNLTPAAPVTKTTIVAVDSFEERDPSEKAEKKKKAVLNFYHATVDKMVPTNIAFFGFSLHCIFQKHGDIIWMRVIFGGSGISLFSSFFMIGFAAAFKEGELIDNAGFVIFVWLLFLQLQVYNIGICAILCVFANIPIWFIFVIGAKGFCFTVWTWVIYLDEGKFLKEWAKLIFEFLKGWAKVIFEFLNKVMFKNTVLCPRV